MRCSNCGNDIPDGLKFCNQCGAPLKLRCSKCRFDNALGARFCGECGASLEFGPAGPATKAPVDSVGGPQNRHHSTSSERRHLTVLFCDLVGSTELAARLDPEEWQAMVGAYHRTAAAAIERFGGRVAKYLGDGVMAYFGHPEAHDNDAERAARAGLAILEAISYLNQQSGTGASLSVCAQLSVRVGIDSGVVVVGAGAGTETDIFGETPNIAARVQAVAAPHTVLISAATHRLITGLFVVEDCGAKSLKGVERPIQLYRVIQPAGVRGRLAAAAASHGLTPFVGREDEIGMLMNRWQRVLDGEGQVVQIVGEAGIGKSRLVSQFHQQIAGSPHTWIEAAAAPFYQNTPFFPIAELLRQLAWEQIFDRFSDYLREVQAKSEEPSTKSALPPSPSPISKNGGGKSADPPLPLSDMAAGQGEGADSRLTGLQSGLVRAGLKPDEAIPLIAPLLNLPLAAVNTLSSLSPEQQRRRLLATLIEWLRGAGRAQPLVIVIEDLHWADPSTLELIQLLLEQGSTARILLLSTARPEFSSEWPRRAHHTLITLSRLNARDVREMIAQVAARDVLASEALETVVERTSGVPLFVEELTRAVLESGDAEPTAREIPVTLHDSLMARLDRLGSAKEVLQIGSVIGGEFTYQLLLAVHPVSDEDLQHQLRRLTDADLLHVRGLAPDATYQFKHALIRDAAYEALLRSRRKELHRLVAHTIDERFPDIKDLHPEVLARHWTEGSDIERAIAEWSKAGKAADARNAFIEASHSYRRALELLKTLPDNIERAGRELALLVSLGVTLIATRGYAAPDVEKTYKRARDLCHQTGDNTQLIPVLGGLWQFHVVRAEYQIAQELGEQILARADQSSDPDIQVLAHDALGQTLFGLGELHKAQVHLEHTLLLYNSLHHDRLTFLCGGEDPGIACHDFQAWTLWMRGYPDRALQTSRSALILGEQLVHLHSLAHALTFSSGIHLFCGNKPSARNEAESLLKLASEHGLAFFSALAMLLRSSAVSEHTAEELVHMREALSRYEATGAVLFRPFLLALFAQAAKEAGRVEEGLNAITEALAVTDKTAERFYEPEQHRLRGELLLFGSGDSKITEAQGCFKRAIEIARNQGARSWELRATTSLARLWRDTGRHNEALTILADIYRCFTEGFDTRDLKDAKAVLDSSSA